MRGPSLTNIEPLYAATQNDSIVVAYIVRGFIINLMIIGSRNTLRFYITILSTFKLMLSIMRWRLHSKSLPIHHSTFKLSSTRCSRRYQLSWPWISKADCGRLIYRLVFLPNLLLTDFPSYMPTFLFTFRLNYYRRIFLWTLLFSYFLSHVVIYLSTFFCLFSFLLTFFVIYRLLIDLLHYLPTYLFCY